MIKSFTANILLLLFFGLLFPIFVFAQNQLPTPPPLLPKNQSGAGSITSPESQTRIEPTLTPLMVEYNSNKYLSKKFIESNQTIKVKGLSKQYKKAFLDEYAKSVLVDYLRGYSNYYLKDKRLFPILINVSYLDSDTHQGLIMLSIHYSPKWMSSNLVYIMLDKNTYYSIYGYGDQIPLGYQNIGELYPVFENRLLSSLINYFRAVVNKTMDFSMWNNFEMAIRLVKSDGTIFFWPASHDAEYNYNLTSDVYVVDPSGNLHHFTTKRPDWLPSLVLDEPYTKSGKKSKCYWFYKFFNMPISKGNHS